MDKYKLPVLILDNIVLFPYGEMRLEFDSQEEKQLISLAEGCFDSSLLIVHAAQSVDGQVGLEKLPTIGIAAQIKMRIDMPNGKTRLGLVGTRRVMVDSYLEENNVLNASCSDIEVLENISKEEKAYLRKIRKTLEKYVDSDNLYVNLLNSIVGIDSVDVATDLIALGMTLDYSRRITYIEAIEPIVRAKMILEDIENNQAIMEIEKEIDQKLSFKLEEQQKEFILREKIKLIKEELGDVNTKDTDIENLRIKIKELEAPEKVKKRLELEITRYETSNPSSPESGIIRNYIDWLLSLPWNNDTEDNFDLKDVKNLLDETHYGLDKVKMRITEYLAVKKNTNSLKSPIICLVGPPGVGKTSLAKSIAESLSRKSTKISVGGVNDEAEIVGHRRTYVGAAPGLIIQGMKKAGVSNPVFIIDEIDKMTKDIKGDPASSLLEVLDPEQNKHFADHYIEEEYDLSKVMFITTANYYEAIPRELIDRLEVIELSSYTEYEKLDIGKKHLLPRELKDHGLLASEVSFSDEVILTIIRYYTREAGVRELQRMMATILRKIVLEKLTTDTNSFEVTDFNIEKYLGKKKYHLSTNDLIERVGVVNGLAYTSFGGNILPIEMVMYPGKGNLTLTGTLGEVMKESFYLTYDYIRSNYKAYGVNYDLFELFDVHMHVPEGAVPKDGPSAGVTITTALLSLFKNVPIDPSVAMSGEMTLRGKVLPIGGLKEKVIGAHRNDIKTIYLPRLNEKDLDEIPANIKEDIKFVFVDRYEDIYRRLFKGSRVRRQKSDPRNIRLALD